MAKFKERYVVLNTQEVPKLTVRSIVVDNDAICFSSGFKIIQLKCD